MRGLLLILALAACTEPQGLAKEDVAESVCSCLFGLPSQVNACVDQLEAALPDPSPACKRCVDDATCSEINDCSALCFGQPKETFP